MFKNILIPTDGSEFSEKTVDDGMELAKTIKATVTGVYVFSTVHIIPVIEFGPTDDVILEQMRAQGQKSGNQFLDRLETAAKNAGVKFDRIIVEHNLVWQGILRAAQTKRCDLIMMAAHGRRGLSALLVGSETNKVLTHSKIPVLVYR